MFGLLAEMPAVSQHHRKRRFQDSHMRSCCVSGGALASGVALLTSTELCLTPSAPWSPANCPCLVSSLSASASSDSTAAVWSVAAGTRGCNGKLYISIYHK